MAGEEWEVKAVKAPGKGAVVVSEPGKEWETAAPDPEPTRVDDPGSPVWTGLGQGLTMRFGDEMMAKLEEILGNGTYRENWERKQRELAALREMSPGTMAASEAAGAIGGFLIPGGAIAKGVGLASKIPAALRGAAGLAALQGALEGAGGSSAPLAASPGQLAIDTGQGALEGLLGAKLVDGGVGLAKAGWRRIREPVLREAANPVFRVPREVAKDVLANAQVYANPVIESVEDIIQSKIVPAVNRISAGIDAKKVDAVSKLTQDPVTTPGELSNDFLDRLMDKKVIFADRTTGQLKSQFGGAPLKDLEVQQELAESIAGKKGFLTQQELGEFYEAIRPHAKYQSTGTGGSQQLSDAWTQFRGAINERLRANPEYDKAMKEVQKGVTELEDLRKTLGLQKSADRSVGRYDMNDQTIGKIKSIAKRDRRGESVAADDLDAFMKTQAPDEPAITAQIRRAANEDSFAIRGMGAKSVAGAATGNPILSALGITLDTAGGKIWKKMATSQPSSTPSALSPFLRPGVVSLSTTPMVSQPVANPYAAYE